MWVTNSDKAARNELMRTALDHLRQGIELLDQADAPGQIAAHVDLAVHQLNDAIDLGLKTNQGRHDCPNLGTLSPS